MLTNQEVLNLNFYKKSHYTGWINPIRFLIKREEVDENAIFHAWVWPGPYIFDLVDEKDKLEFTTTFNEEGKQEVVNWINEQYELYKDIWSTKKI